MITRHRAGTVLGLPICHPVAGICHWQEATHIAPGMTGKGRWLAGNGHTTYVQWRTLLAWLHMALVPSTQAAGLLHRAHFGRCSGSCTLNPMEDAEAPGAALQDLKEAMDHKDSFLSVMSHELRTPINGIMGELGLHAEGVCQIGCQTQIPSTTAITNTAVCLPLGLSLPANSRPEGFLSHGALSSRHQPLQHQGSNPHSLEASHQPAAIWTPSVWDALHCCSTYNSLISSCAGLSDALVRGTGGKLNEKGQQFLVTINNSAHHLLNL